MDGAAGCARAKGQLRSVTVEKTMLDVALTTTQNLTTAQIEALMVPEGVPLRREQVLARQQVIDLLGGVENACRVARQLREMLVAA